MPFYCFGQSRSLVPLSTKVSMVLSISKRDMGLMADSLETKRVLDGCGGRAVEPTVLRAPGVASVTHYFLPAMLTAARTSSATRPRRFDTSVGVDDPPKNSLMKRSYDRREVDTVTRKCHLRACMASLPTYFMLYLVFFNLYCLSLFLSFLGIHGRLFILIISALTGQWRNRFNCGRELSGYCRQNYYFFLTRTGNSLSL